MIELQVGIGEIIAALVAGAGFIWWAVRLSLGQFEKRLDTKFEQQDNRLNALEMIAVEIKKMEVEQIRVESRINITHATKEEVTRAIEKLEATHERIFGLLNNINNMLQNKVDKDELHRFRDTERGHQ